MQTASVVSNQDVRGAVTTKESGVTLTIAREGLPLLNFRKLVFEEYAKRGWLDTSQYPDGVVTDAFDSASDALVITSGDEIIAGMRIVRDCGLGFPHEQELRLNECLIEAPKRLGAFQTLANTQRNRMAEITKVVGKKKRRMLTFDIVKCLYWYATTCDIDLYLMVIDMEFFILCDTLGVPISPIGIPVYCEGSWTIPAITQPSRYEAEIIKKSPHGWEYISTPYNLDHTWTVH